MVLRIVGILRQHYTTSQPRGPRHEYKYYFYRIWGMSGDEPVYFMHSIENTDILWADFLMGHI